MSAKPIGLKPVQGLMSVYQSIEKVKVPLHESKAFLHKDAAASLYSANIQIVEAGGRLYISDMWRNPEEQFKNWLDFKSGRKATYSPPPGCSMHESGRAIDIDTRESQLKLPHSKIREILAAHGWYPIVEIGQPGDWHYEHRDLVLTTTMKEHGYKEMVKMAFFSIRYKGYKYDGIDYEEAAPQNWS